MISRVKALRLKYSRKTLADPRDVVLELAHTIETIADLFGVSVPHSAIYKMERALGVNPEQARAVIVYLPGMRSSLNELRNVVHQGNYDRALTLIHNLYGYTSTRSFDFYNFFHSIESKIIRG